MDVPWPIMCLQNGPNGCRLHRIELNTMTTPQFLQWLDDKMDKFGQGKLIPPEAILTKELHETAREKLAQDITDQDTNGE